MWHTLRAALKPEYDVNSKKYYMYALKASKYVYGLEGTEYTVMGKDFGWTTRLPNVYYSKDWLMDVDAAMKEVHFALTSVGWIMFRDDSEHYEYVDKVFKAIINGDSTVTIKQFEVELAYVD